MVKVEITLAKFFLIFYRILYKDQLGFNPQKIKPNKFSTVVHVYCLEEKEKYSHHHIRDR